ncbi:myb-like dna-binding shaqkyf class family protein [Stylonychia lemnae]|uniref:Myb-like dna-binding shaqkyf class family protein n=1 Tax=Stylonychia lemnae TaxID=5949 RepID=A0A078AJF4_STYLE|nr:myb-like dna-binding shaqkyf class family protein [Stylonychia lemnae]|eukprot:CDW80903.1 myb-like dna-binding shaqkyf class family protein [Stylonychia lemnae]
MKLTNQTQIINQPAHITCKNQTMKLGNNKRSRNTGVSLICASINQLNKEKKVILCDALNNDQMTLKINKQHENNNTAIDILMNEQDRRQIMEDNRKSNAMKAEQSLLHEDIEGILEKFGECGNKVQDQLEIQKCQKLISTISNLSSETSTPREIVFQVNPGFGLKQQRLSFGRWSNEEHDKFIDALRTYGKNWRMVFESLNSRSEQQIRSHAQKFFNKLKKRKTCKDLDIYKVLESYNSRQKDRYSSKTQFDKIQALWSLKKHPISKDKLKQEELYQFKKNQLFDIKREKVPQMFSCSNRISQVQEDPSIFSSSINKTLQQTRTKDLFEVSHVQKQQIRESQYNYQDSTIKNNQLSQVLQSLSNSGEKKSRNKNIFLVTKVSKDTQISEEGSTDTWSSLRPLRQLQQVQISQDEFKQFLAWKKQQQFQTQTQLAQLNQNNSKISRKNSIDSIFNMDQDIDQNFSLQSRKDSAQTNFTSESYDNHSKKLDLMYQQSSSDSCLDVTSFIADEENEYINENQYRDQEMSDVSQYLSESSKERYSYYQEPLNDYNLKINQGQYFQTGEQCALDCQYSYEIDCEKIQMMEYQVKRHNSVHQSSNQRNKQNNQLNQFYQDSFDFQHEI